jgi:hypothetical protein
VIEEVSVKIFRLFYYNGYEHLIFYLFIYLYYPHFRAIANAPQNVTDSTPGTDLNIPYVSEVTQEIINKRYNNPEAHPNPLLEPPLQPTTTCN